MMIPHSPPKNILFICIGGLGDLLFLSPALELFSQIWPQAKLHFLVSATGSRQLVELHPQTGTIIEIRPTIGAILSRLRALRRLQVDLVFASAGTNALFCGLIGLLSGAPYRVGEAYGFGKLLYTVQCPYRQDELEVATNSRMASAVALGKAPPNTCSIWTSDQDRRAAADYMAKMAGVPLVIGFHLGSGPAMTFKRWPVERFVELGRRIIARHDARIIIFGGKEEQREAQAAAAAMGNNAWSAAGELSIREAYEAMKYCSLFVSNDSGPMHCAAAAGCRVIALFGPTLPGRTAPLGEGHRIVIAGMDCQPCYDFRSKKIRCSTEECMLRISVDVVETNVEQCISERVSGRPS
jgi:ADP-heptose:LPS heptosyltransferase